MKKIFSIWMQPVYARLNMGDHKVWLMTLATLPMLTMGIVVMGSYKGNNPLIAGDLLSAAEIGIAVGVFLMLIIWFFLLVHSVGMQYSPANARLLPHLKRHAQWALALPILLLPALVVAALEFWSTTKSWSVSWLIGVLGMLMLVALLRTKWVTVILVVAAQLPLFADQKYFSDEQLMALNHPVLLLVFGLLMSALVLRWTFAMGADQHMLKRQQFAEIQMAMEGNPQFARRSMPIFLSVYPYLLKRRLKSAQNAKVLLPFSLGPQAHWSSTFLQIAAISVAISIYVFFMITRNPAATKEDESFHLFLFFPMFAVMLFVHAFVMLNATYQTRIEQGLVGLAPRSGSQAQQTRTLLGYLLNQYFLLWSCTLVVAIASCILLAPSSMMRDAIYLACFSLLPLSVCLLKNHAKAQGSQDSLVIHNLMACAAIFGVALTLLMKLSGISVWTLCALIAVFTACTLIWRWRKLLALPAVFPAGRGA